MRHVALLVAVAAFLLRAAGAPDDDRLERLLNGTAGVSLRQGRRSRMEDRIAETGMLGDTSCRLWAVFDGHEGTEAAHFTADFLPAVLASDLSTRSNTVSKETLEASVHAAVAKTDAAFLADTRSDAGTTAILAVACGASILIASIGDSYAIMCGRKPAIRKATGHQETPEGAAQTRRHHRGKGNIASDVLSAVHSPGRPDEERRIVAAGGFVQTTADGRARLQGELMISRSIGDRPYRSVGLISKPEFHWHTLQPEDAFMILASDGLLEKLDPPSICALALATAAGDRRGYERAQLPLSIPLGPASTEPVTQRGFIPLPCTTQLPGCVDCCQHSASGVDDQEPPKQPPTVQQAVAEALQEAAWNRTALDNIAVLVLDVRTGPSSVQSGALVRATSAQGQSRAAQREALRSGSTVAPSTTGGGHSYELDELLTALPQRLLHSAADSLHRFLASGDNPRTGRAPSLVQDAVFGASESGLAADFAHAHRKVTMSDSGGAVNGSGIGAEVVPSATVTVLARIAWRWLRWAQLAVADLCGGPRLVEGASGAQQAGVGTALVSVLAGVPMAPDQDYDQPITAWQHAMRPALPATASDEGNPGWGGLGGGSDSQQNDWSLGSSFGRGHFGEVWRGTRQRHAESPVGGKERRYVLKRLMDEKGTNSPQVRLSGLREAYFGRLLRDQGGLTIGTGLDHLVRFVESFESPQKDLWLVFEDEGRSLNSLMYDSAAAGGATPDPPGGGPGGGPGGEPGAHSHLLQPSEWWHVLRRDTQGDEAMRDLLRQMLLALSALHHANVTHRDIKPDNLLLSVAAPSTHPGRGDPATCDSNNSVHQEGQEGAADEDADGSDNSTGSEQANTARAHLRLIDFGSAVDEYSAEHLYGEDGPSAQEQTAEYAPPEATFAPYWHGGRTTRRTWPYDMWSAGVVWLEMLLGTPHVFQVSARTRAVLEHRLHLSRMADHDAAAALLLRGLMELCVYPPQDPRTGGESGGGGSGGGGAGADHLPVSWSCTDDAVSMLLEQRSAVGRAPPSLLAVRLLRRLLHWNPAARPTAAAALRHAYFTVPLADQAHFVCGSLLDGGSDMHWC